MKIQKIHKNNNIKNDTKKNEEVNDSLALSYSRVLDYITTVL